MAKVAKRRCRYVLDFYDQAGARRWITLPKGTTKKQADEELKIVTDQVLKGCYLSERKVPLFKGVAKDWLGYKKPKLRITTWDCYEGHVRKHFAFFDDLKVNRITTAKVEKFITACQTEGMNIHTTRKILVTLNQIFSYAVRHRLIDHNPLRDAERPRDPGETKKEITVLSPPEIKSFLESTPSHKYRVLFMLAVTSGARQGELLALKWSDLDMANGQLHIQRTFQKGQFFTPKTRTSDRWVDLGPATKRELKKWKLACPKSELGMMFPNEEGNPINYTNMVNRHFLPALRAAKLPKIRFHDLRHTYASLLLGQGENVKYIQTQLGHSSPTVTLNVYSHLMEKRNPKAASRLEGTIFRK
ncbi:MAG: tyrosine-type recombinase/integrase [Syntrophobacteraceae bacterium]|jgi:integrase